MNSLVPIIYDLHTKSEYRSVCHFISLSLSVSIYLSLYLCIIGEKSLLNVWDTPYHHISRKVIKGPFCLINVFRLWFYLWNYGAWILSAGTAAHFMTLTVIFIFYCSLYALIAKEIYTKYVRLYH